MLKKSLLVLVVTVLVVLFSGCAPRSNPLSNPEFLQLTVESSWLDDDRIEIMKFRTHSGGILNYSIESYVAGEIAVFMVEDKGFTELLLQPNCAGENFSETKFINDEGEVLDSWITYLGDGLPVFVIILDNGK